MHSEAERRAAAEKVAAERLTLAKQQEQKLLHQLEQMKKEYDEELTMVRVSLDSAQREITELQQRMTEAKEALIALESQVPAAPVAQREVLETSTSTSGPPSKPTHIDGLAAAARVAKKLVRWTEEARATSRRIDELAEQEAEEEARRANEHAALLKEHAEAERLRVEMERAKAEAAHCRKEESERLRAAAEAELEELERQHEEEKRKLETQLHQETLRQQQLTNKEHAEVEKLRLQMQQMKAEAEAQHELERQALVREHVEAEKFRKLAEEAQTKRDKERAEEAIRAAAKARVELDALEQQHKAERKLFNDKKEQAKAAAKLKRGASSANFGAVTPVAVTTEVDLLNQQLEDLREKRVADLTLALKQSADIEALQAEVQDLQRQLKEARAQILQQSQK
jgi:hypothetical protein